MTTSPTEHDMPSSERRTPWPWLIAGAGVVAAAVVVMMVLTAGGTDTGNRNVAATNTTAATEEPGTDLSTPEAAAEAFAAAAETGSGDALLDLACLGRPACVREHAAGVSEAQVTEAQTTIREGVFELAEHLKGAEFTKAVDGSTPGTKDVPYRTPALTGDAYLTLTFIQSEGDWLYYQPAS